MAQEMSSERVWPYVLPFPLDPEKRRLIWGILQSRVGLKILGKVSVDGQTHQQDLIELLPYSNKSIIKYLKKMVKAKVLEEGMKPSTEKGRVVWIKWYRPTSLGRWLILFLKSPTEVTQDSAKTIIEELFRVYSSNIVEVCQKYKMDIDSFHRELDTQYLMELAKNQPQIQAEVAVFGSAALDIYGSLEQLPTSDEVAYVNETNRFPGGMGANVAVALSRLGVPVAFCGRIGNDSAGRVLLENLSENKVDLSGVRFEGSSSLQTLVLSDVEKHRWLFAVGSPQSAMSLASLQEVSWEVLDFCKVIYIGEVFVEVARAVAEYAETRGKIIIYRLGAPYARFGVENLHGLIEHATILILNRPSWERLRSASKEVMKSPVDLLKHGPEKVILTKGGGGCEVFSSRKHEDFPVAPELLAKFRTVDPTGAGDSFSAGLIKGLLDGWSLEDAVSYGQAAASITCSRDGTGNVFPTEKEVEAALGLLGQEKRELK